MISLDNIEPSQEQPKVTEPIDDVTPPIVKTTTIIEEPPIREVVIEIGGGYFDPEEITVPVGTTVIWENNDRRAHRVAANPPNREFYGDRIVPGETYSYTFTNEGVFNYADINFFTMTGSIIVESRSSSITGNAIEWSGEANFAGAAFLILIGVIMAFIVSMERK
ncbi:MAG: cupredoxin domain-containing protein [Candidatus Woesearchaeota archaeon]|nr:cupredoxin domain-containing protein [Candidatus Woesearchaeota archaeon]